MNAILLKTKTELPKPGPFVISRPRLNQKLSSCLKRKLTLVTAPSGYGKTAALQKWADGCGAPCVWLTADAGDNDPRVFWRYVCAALDAVLPGVREDTDYVFSSQELLEANTHIKIIIDRACELAQDCALIIDDTQVITNWQIFKGLSYFTDFLPQRLHLVVIGRAQPGGGLAGYELKSGYYHIGAGDLRFRKEEIAAFFEKTGLPVTPADIVKLENYTEGWAAALVAIALSMENLPGVTDLAAGIYRSSYSIEQYLQNEVFSVWTAEKRRFVLETSVLGTLSGELCDYVTGGGGAAQTLAGMSARNEFVISLDGQNYRYHNIFRESLYQLFMRTEPHRVRELHARAADWYCRQGRVPEAIANYLVGLRYEEAYRLIDGQLGELVMANAFDTGIAWLCAVPEALWEKSPRAAAFYSAYYTQSRQYDLAHKWLEKAKELLADTTEPGRREMKNVVNLLWLYLLLNEGKTGGPQALPVEFSPGENRKMLAKYLDFNRSDIYFYRCPVRAMADLAVEHQDKFEVILSEYRKLASVNPGYSLLAQGEYYYENNRPDEAMPYLTAAVERARAAECPGVMVPAMVDLARIKRAKGDLAGAFEALEACEEDLKPLNRYHWFSLVRAFRARLSLEAGDVDTALGWAGENKLSIYGELNPINEFELLVFARVLMKKRKYEDARLLLLRLLAFADAEGRPHSKTEVLNLLSIVARKKNDPALMAQYMEESLAIGMEKGFVRSYLDEGRELLEPLRHMVGKSGGEHNTAAFAGGLAAQIEGETGAAAPAAGTQPADKIRKRLTARELEVLELLYAARTNDEICEKLGIGLRTVKTHTGSIYAKLGVANRVQCNKLVREAGMFEPG
ncbi:MAG TPA: LuxR C-terminal-related transcriptional regulator [Candidatus Acidoferrum sp.]|nr:LuxR C-terminal-related transcriptional regulator [Candidatus Acidoferrum sp.]